MNVIKLMGGLGNQFFQYAFGNAMQIRGIDVKFDTTWYMTSSRRYPRPFVLDKYMICDCMFGGTHRGLNFKKEHNTFDIHNLNLTNTYFDGYWQYYPYFRPILPILKKEFQLKPEYKTSEYESELKLIQSYENPASIHIRRGDYLNQKGWGVLPLGYYYEALTSLRENEVDAIFIFSDDIPYVTMAFEQRFFVPKLHVVGLNNPYLEFELMRNCKFNVIANSTYSYWAAMLNEVDNHQIICPGRYLGETNIDENELHYPKNWNKLNY